jgi:hypothetical protein
MQEKFRDENTMSSSRFVEMVQLLEKKVSSKNCFQAVSVAFQVVDCTPLPDVEPLR